MQIGLMKAILEPFKIEKVSTQNECPRILVRRECFVKVENGV